MSDLSALTKRAEFAAHEADVADESVAGLKRHIANLESAAAEAKTALKGATTHATEARAAAKGAAAELEAAQAELAEQGEVAARVGTASGTAG